MSDTERVLWTAVATLAGGLCLFVAGQFVSEMLFKPYLRFRAVLEETSSTLIYRSGVLCSLAWKEAPDIHKEIHHEVRKLAGKLRAAARQIPFYGMFALLKLVPTKSNLKAAAGLLIRLSNTTGDPSSFEMRYDDIGKIGALLGIDTGR